jgi:hypothetical protein
MRKQILVLSLLSFLLVDCSKKKGCTDRNATNYDSSAEKDDGSCIFPAAGDVLTDITSDRVLVNGPNEVDYTLNTTIDVNAKLTIEPGVIIQCNAGSGIYVGSNAGAIKAIGTSASPIIFRSASGQKGAWKGIKLENSNNVENEFTYCVIKDGGSGSFNGNGNLKANLQMSGTTQVKIKNTKIDNSADVGLRVEKFTDVTITSFVANSFSDNAKAPIRMLDQMVPSLDGLATTFSNNGKNYIELIAKTFDGVEDNVIWKKQNIPYAFFNEGDNLTCGYYTNTGSITLEAGVTLLMGPGSRIIVGDNANTTGYLKCLGTVAEPVNIKGVQEQAGAWDGIIISTTSANNNWTYTNVQHGGGASLSNNVTKKTNILIGSSEFDNASLTVSNSTTSNSFGCGYVKTTPYDNTISILLNGTLTGSGNGTALMCTN